MTFTSRWCSAVIPIVVASARVAHADEPNVTREQFTTATSHERVEALACSLQTISAADGVARWVDIRVNGKRCGDGPVADTVPVDVHVEPRLDGQSVVVVEAMASDDIKPSTLRTIVVETRDDLAQRCDSERVPVPVRRTVFEDRWRARPALIATGILLTALGAVAGGGGGAIVTTRYDPCSRSNGFFDLSLCFNDAMPAFGGVLIALGSALVLVGVPLIAYGAQSRRVQVRVSATGATFEGTF